jgi:hypothetical protein
MVKVKPTIAGEANHPEDRRFAISDPSRFWQFELAIVGADRA